MDGKNKIDDDNLDLDMYQEILVYAWDLAHPHSVFSEETHEKYNARMQKRRPEFYKIAFSLKGRMIDETRTPVLNREWKEIIDGVL